MFFVTLFKKRNDFQRLAFTRDERHGNVKYLSETVMKEANTKPCLWNEPPTRTLDNEHLWVQWTRRYLLKMSVRNRGLSLLTFMLIVCTHISRISVLPM